MNTTHKETKSRKVIGTMRLYNHAKLLSFLEKVGMTIEDWKTRFDADHTRDQFLAMFAKTGDIPEGMIEREIQFENITPTIGFQTITKFLSGNGVSAAELEVMVHAFGDDNTAPSMSDTGLGNETVRKLISSKSYNGVSAFYTVFYDLPEGNGTHAEMGLFMNADPMVADDGTLWDRSLISITKGDTQSLTIDYEDTFVNNL